ncbi:hypothetical protein BBJ29_004928 [Phytophthora kernoviae]|uniref:Amino acid transporter n=1 Tax=Phytophthora kernoviae TaxID=325452 RepID=A0A421FXB6_9STRA|nr:hypothetical protein BBJ29_004928 [Phytophthora kernoviae]
MASWRSGVALGILLNAVDTPSVAITWIGTPGDLFIRAVQCLVTPLIFCGLVVSMADMTLLTCQTANIGGRTLILYLLTTAVATTVGLCMALLFRNAFDATPFPANETAVAIECGDRPGHYLTWSTNGTVSCTYYGSLDSSSAADDYEAVRDKPALFLERDLNGTYQRAEDTFQDLSLTEALMTQLNAFVPNNITQAFAEGTLLSVITFAVLFGMILSRHRLKAATEVIRDLNVAFMTLIGWIIKWTPIAICSLLAAAIANSKDLRTLLKGVAVYCACDICGQFVRLVSGRFPQRVL